jgi:hypothetical protein
MSPEDHLIFDYILLAVTVVIVVARIWAGLRKVRGKSFKARLMTHLGTGCIVLAVLCFAVLVGVDTWVMLWTMYYQKHPEIQIIPGQGLPAEKTITSEKVSLLS